MKAGLIPEGHHTGHSTHICQCINTPTTNFSVGVITPMMWTREVHNSAQPVSMQAGRPARSLQTTLSTLFYAILESLQDRRVICDRRSAGRVLTILCCRCFFLSLMSSLCCRETKLTAAYSSRAANTNRRHTAIQISMAFT